MRRVWESGSWQKKDGHNKGIVYRMCWEATRVVLHLGSKSEALLSPLGLKGQRREVTGAERGSSIERGPPATSWGLGSGCQPVETRHWAQKVNQRPAMLSFLPSSPSQLLFLLSGSNEAARSPTDSVQRGVPPGPRTGSRRVQRGHGGAAENIQFSVSLHTIARGWMIMLFQTSYQHFAKWQGILQSMGSQRVRHNLWLNNNWFCNITFFNWKIGCIYSGLSSWLRQWRICLQCWRPGFNLWVGKTSWRRKWQHTPVFLLGNPMDRGAWQAIVHGVAKSQTRLSD